MAAEWFFTQKGQQVGPVSPEQLKQMVTAGQLPPGELVWKEGLPNWVPAQSVPGLFTPQQLAAGLLPPAPPPPGGTPVQSYEYNEARRGRNQDDEDDERHTERRRKRKKKRKQTGMPTGLKVGLIVGGCLFGGVLLIVLIILVVMPLLSADSLRTFAGTYPVALNPGEKNVNNSVYLKQGQWVTVTVSNTGSLAIFDVAIFDPSKKYIVTNKSKQGLQLTVNFEVRETGHHTIEVRNLGPSDGNCVVAWNGNKQSL